MLPLPKTIQIFLPGGDPQGIRIAEITTRIVQVLEVPRALLDKFFAMPESEQVSLYFLFGDMDDGERGVYIGQTGSPRTRLALHNKEKDFWDRVLVVISRTQNLTQTHVGLLEWLSIDRAAEVGRYVSCNGNAGTKPYTPAPMEADCMEIFETTGTLMTTLGYPVFQSLTKPPSVSTPENEDYICTRGGSSGRGQYTAEGFIVFSGSRGSKELMPSGTTTHAGRTRERLIQEQKAEIVGDEFLFTRDTLFNSPSAASCTLIGGSSNGWIDWMTPDGRTLDYVIRKSDTQSTR